MLSECRRVLKDDGVLAFSFHHSRAEGWAAIYEAITKAGLEVVAAHPVHAEQRGASPKTATKDPISLDAILVCRKHTDPTEVFDIHAVLARSMSFAKTLVSAGMEVSRADRFVIAASQTLIFALGEQLSFDDIKSRLELVRERLDNESTPIAISARDSVRSELQTGMVPTS